MRYLPRVTAVALFLFFVLPVACVTINIYFPAEEVESVAGEIVNDIRGQPSEEPRQTEEKDKNQSFFSLRGLVAALAPSAVAQDVTTVSNATIRELKGRMKARYDRLKPYFAQDVLEEGGNGYVEIGSTGSLSVREKSDLRNLVAAENRDRQQLYREVAKALNIDAGQVDRVAQIFAKEWQKSAP